MAKKQYKRTHFYSIAGMLTDEEVHKVWEIAVSYTHLTLPTR